MTSNSKLEFKTAFIVLFITSILIGGLVFTGNYLSNKRKQDVYNKYAAETNNWMSHNREGLDKVFSEVFTAFDLCQSETGIKNKITCPDIQTTPRLISQDLKDWSSTGFIKESEGNIEYMGILGHVSNFDPYPKEEKNSVYKLLRGEIESVPWEDYIYDLPGKDVIIPYKDSSGKVIGAVVRGVIETPEDK